MPWVVLNLLRALLLGERKMKRIYTIKESIFTMSGFIAFGISPIKSCYIENHEVLEKLTNGDCVVRSDDEIVKIKSKDVFAKYDDAVKHLKVVQKKVSAWNKKEEMLIEKKREESYKKEEKHFDKLSASLNREIEEAQKELALENKKQSTLNWLVYFAVVIAVMLTFILLELKG